MALTRLPHCQHRSTDLTILTAAAKVGGEPHKLERVCALLHLDYLHPLSSCTADLAARVIDATAITPQTFVAANRNVHGSVIEDRRLLARSLREVGEVDGRLAAEEHELLAILPPALQTRLPHPYG